MKRFTKWLCALCALCVLLSGVSLAEETSGISDAASIILPAPQQTEESQPEAVTEPDSISETQDEAAGEPEPADEPQQEAAGEPEPADEPQQEAADEPEPADEPQQEAAGEPKPADEPQEETAGEPEPADEPQEETAGEPEPADEQQEEAAGEPEPAGKQQDEAADKPQAKAAAISASAAELQSAATPIPEPSVSAHVNPAYTAYADTNDIRGFVYRMYKIALDREPEPEGFTFWVEKLESGQLQAADLVRSFLGSEEYASLGKTNEQIVTDCYQVMLNRNPEPDGFEFWKKRLDVGMTFMSVCSGFVGSPEFANLAAKYGIQPGTIKVTNARDKDYDRTAFVYRLYVNCLERAPETSGLEHWCKMLAGGMSGTNVASGFVFSIEYKNRLESNENYVEMLYRTILGRGSEPNGKSHWVNLLDYTNTREHLLNGFMGSKEFSIICSQASVPIGKPIYEPDNDREWKANVLVLSLVNAERQKAGLAPLKTREDLWERAAMVRANEVKRRLAQVGGLNMDHIRPDDGSIWYTVYDDAGFDYCRGGENIAWGFRNEQDVMYYDKIVNNKRVTGWMGSIGHRENILNPDYAYVATGLFQGAYWSQNFITLFP